MAFPTSPSNNQVHKEGQRAFVYDSTLGVWDQVRTPARTESNLSHTTTTGSFPSGITFPTGHVLQVTQGGIRSSITTAGTTNAQIVKGYTASITPKAANSNIYVQWSFMHCTTSSVTARSYIQRAIGSGNFSDLSDAMGVDAGGGDPGIGHAGGSASEAWMTNTQAGFYLDDPTYTLGDKISYRIGVRNENASDAITIGATIRDSTGYHPRNRSMLILFEVAG